MDVVCVYKVEACVSVQQTFDWSQNAKVDAFRVMKLVYGLCLESKVFRCSGCSDLYVS